VKEYPGIDPILLERCKTVGRLVQSGSAIAIAAYPPAASPVLPSAPMLEPPEIVRSPLNAVERQTQWTYVMAVTDPTWDLSKLAGGA